MAINSTWAMGFARRRSLTVPKVRAPRSANSCAVSRPIPDETPVTNAIVLVVIFVLPSLFLPGEFPLANCHAFDQAADLRSFD
jgi:hypothetical protein